MADALVPLCNCTGIGQAQAIRASLEARGVPALIDGEHMRNMLGMFGTVATVRIMVPRSQLRLAYRLALEIIEDLPEPDFDDEDDDEHHLREPMPLRRALPEDLVPYPDDEDDDDDEDDEGDEGDGRAGDGRAGEAGDPHRSLLAPGPREIGEQRSQLSPFGARLVFISGIVIAIASAARGHVVAGVAQVVILLGLVYLRVLPLGGAPSEPEQPEPPEDPERARDPELPEAPEP